MKDSIYNSSATSIAAAIRNKEVSSEEITRTYIERIKEVNPKINAVVQLAAEKALAEAKKTDAELQSGKLRGPLHGVPFTIKDTFETSGVITTFGTLGRKDHIPDIDATVVSRLKGAGAILSGKTNTPELALASDTSNLVYGTTRNPFNTEKSPGVTSGGSGANMAAGGAAFEIGSDIAGSVRLPAHFCGICSLKPTSGRVSRYGYSGSFYDQTQEMSCVGHMARYVEDLITLFPIISGSDGIDPFTNELPVEDPYGIDIRNLRFAWYTDNGKKVPIPNVVGSIKAAAGKISSAGAQIEETRPGEVVHPGVFFR